MAHLNALKLYRDQIASRLIFTIILALSLSFGRAEPVSLRISSGSPTFMAGQPASLSFSVTNNSTNSVSVSIREVSLSPVNTAQSGLHLRPDTALTASRISSVVEIMPNQTIDRELLVGEHVVFSKAGPYAMVLSVQLSVQSAAEPRHVAEFRVPVKFHVTATDRSKLLKMFSCLSEEVNASVGIERERAVKRLASSGHPEAIPFLEEMVRSGVGRVPVLAVEGLGRGQGPEFDQAIARLSGHDALRSEVREQLDVAKRQRELGRSVHLPQKGTSQP